jgi:ribosome modulation factor
MATPFQKSHYWLQGWKDGSSIRSVKKLRGVTPDLSQAYSDGYTEGVAARRTATYVANARYGYTPTYLKPAES